MSSVPKSKRVRIRVSRDDQEVRTVELGQGLLKIGRRPYNDLVLDDLTVSGEHAQLLVDRNGCLLRDLNSRNGTMMGDRQVSEIALGDGAIVDIGIYRLHFGMREATPEELVSDELVSGLMLGAPRSAQRPSETAVEGPGTATSVGLASADAQAAPAHDAAPARELKSAMPTDAPALADAAPDVVADEPVATNDTSSGEGHAIALAERAAPATDALAELAVSGDAVAFIEHTDGPYKGIRQRLERGITRLSDGQAQVAVLSRRKTGFFLTHLEGPERPRVNGEAIGLAGRRLEDGDHVDLAGARFTFRQPDRQ
ncbi:MAG: FHA domain-containing protein [Burkholderiaceae bacterium]